MSRPWNRISPSVGASIWVIRFSRVDLPEPEGPTIVRNSPSPEPTNESSPKREPSPRRGRRAARIACRGRAPRAGPDLALTPAFTSRRAGWASAGRQRKSFRSAASTPAFTTNDQQGQRDECGEDRRGVEVVRPAWIR